jgi:hypothetical protein
MPGQNRTAALPSHKGWWHDGINNRLVAVFNGTEIFDFDGNDLQATQALTAGGTLTATGVFTASAEARVANGFNVRVGTISAFATTEPTNAIVFKQGTAFAGAIVTSGGLQSSATVVTKIIAAGTVSNVET